MEALTAWEAIRTGGPVTMLAMVLYGGLRRWWVFGWLYAAALEDIDEMRKERDEWRLLALSQTSLAKEAVDVLRRGGGA